MQRLHFVPVLLISLSLALPAALTAQESAGAPAGRWSMRPGLPTSLFFPTGPRRHRRSERARHRADAGPRNDRSEAEALLHGRIRNRPARSASLGVRSLRGQRRFSRISTHTVSDNFHSGFQFDRDHFQVNQSIPFRQPLLRGGTLRTATHTGNRASSRSPEASCGSAAWKTIAPRPTTSSTRRSAG